MWMVLVSLALAQETSGFAEVRGIAYAGVDGTPWVAVQRVRPTFVGEISKRVVFTSTIEASLSEGRRTDEELARTIDASELGPVLEAFACSWPENDNELFDIDQVSDWLTVERLFVDVYLPSMDLRIGRQALNWGSATFINPTSLFPEVLFAEPWRFRSGVNAARATIPLPGGMHSVQAVVATDDLFTQIRGGGRVTVDAWGTDISAVGVYRSDDQGGFVGLDVKGTLGVGYWFEGAVHLDDSDAPYEELAVGIDYSFEVLERFVLGAQYYRNGSGATDPADYELTSRFEDSVPVPECDGIDTTDLFGEVAEPTPFAPFTAARNYFLLFANVGVVPELSIALVGFQNLDDGTGIVVPTVSTFPTPWLEVSLNAQVPYQLWGDGGELHPSDEMLQLSLERDGTDLGSLDLSGLVPDATFTLWARASW